MPANSPFPPMPPPFQMPFFYASASFFWTYYLVHARAIAGFLEGTGLKVARFSDVPADRGLVSLNFQNYGSHLGQMLGTTNEVEFNLHVYPACREKDVPIISLDDYLMGQEQTKLIGSFRLHVPADDAVAVQAGIEVFGERKFLTSFTYDVPCANSQFQTDPKSPGKRIPKPWRYTVNDPADKALSIYSVSADLRGFTPVAGNASPITLYSMLPGGPNRPPGGRGQRLNGSRWNLFGMYQTFHPLPASAGTKVKLTLGKSPHPMRRDMEKLLGKGAKACAIRIFESPPAAAENRPYWVE